MHSEAFGVQTVSPSPSPLVAEVSPSPSPSPLVAEVSPSPSPSPSPLVSEVSPSPEVEALSLSPSPSPEVLSADPLESAPSLLPAPVSVLVPAVSSVLPPSAVMVVRVSPTVGSPKEVEPSPPSPPQPTASSARPRAFKLDVRMSVCSTQPAQVATGTAWASGGRGAVRPGMPPRTHEETRPSRWRRTRGYCGLSTWRFMPPGYA